MQRAYPTTEQTLEFYNFMTEFYDLKVMRKDRSKLMRFVGGFLNAFGIMKYEAFMTRFTTCFWGHMWTSFIVGDHISYPLHRQIATLIHECQHRIQEELEGRFKFTLGYLLSKKYRARMEIQAYIATMSIYYWFTGKHLDIEDLAETLFNYGCGEGEVLTAKMKFEEARDRITAGSLFPEAFVKSLEWLEPRFPVLVR